MHYPVEFIKMTIMPDFDAECIGRFGHMSAASPGSGVAIWKNGRKIYSVG
jgi:hypothetical protein